METIQLQEFSHNHQQGKTTRSANKTKKNLTPSGETVDFKTHYFLTITTPFCKYVSNPKTKKLSFY